MNGDQPVRDHPVQLLRATDHNTCYLGQSVAVRRALGASPNAQ
jgi:hypothetical protein